MGHKGNFVASSEPGCFVAHVLADRIRDSCEWLDNVEELILETFDCENWEDASDLPEISIDPESGLLTVINASQTDVKSFYISVTSPLLPCKTADDVVLTPGEWYNGSGDYKGQCITFVLVVEPKRVVDVCYVSNPSAAYMATEMSDPPLASDVKVLQVPSKDIPLNEERDSYPFPLSSTIGTSVQACKDGQGALSQSESGETTPIQYDHMRDELDVAKQQNRKVHLEQSHASPDKQTHNNYTSDQVRNGCCQAPAVEEEACPDPSCKSNSSATELSNGQKLKTQLCTNEIVLEKPVLRNSTPDTTVLQTNSDKVESYLCSQGCNGWFTHFYPETRYAIDLECPIGTPILAVGEGIIVDIRQTSFARGIHVSNLFSWNSITLQLSNGVVVDYVHIKPTSVKFNVGDAVRQGEVLCFSGAAGFCPTPHLHIQMHESRNPDAPTIPFQFFSKVDDKVTYFVPTAGNFYNENGLVSPS